MVKRSSLQSLQKAIVSDEKIEEKYSKLMKKFQSMLTVELRLTFLTMAGICTAGRLSKFSQANVAMPFLFMVNFSIVAWILSHKIGGTRRLVGLVSGMTQAVTILCMGLFQFAIGLHVPAEYPRYNWFNLGMFFICAFIITCLWKIHFALPEDKISKKD